MIVLGLGFIGCGDNGGGQGGSGGIIVPDGSGGAGGAGPAAGTRLAATGGQLILVNAAQDHAAWIDLGNHAHVVPVNMGADPQAINFSFLDLVTTGAIGWINNTLVINHGLNTSTGVGQFAVWTTGMADALDIPALLNGITADARPIASVSPDGTQVVFSALSNGSTTTADVNIQAVATGSTAHPLVTGLPIGNTCGPPLGNIASWNGSTNTGSFVMLACDPNGTSVLLKKVAITGTTGTSTTISAAGDAAIAFSLSVDATSRQVDGKYAAYLTNGTTNSVKIVDLASGQLVPNATDTVLTLSQTSPFPIGTFKGNDLFYLAPNNVMKKITITGNGTGSTKTTIVSNAADWSGSSFDGTAFSADASKVVYYTMVMMAGNLSFGNMALISTAGGGTALTLNSDNKGYPGDNVFSKNGTYVWWYDNVDTTTTGIGTIHSRKADGSDSAQTVGPLGYFIRQTNTDNIAAVMSNSRAMGAVVTGDLNRVDVSTGTTTLITDHITYMDMVYPTTGNAKVVYTRSDGVYITDFQ